MTFAAAGFEPPSKIPARNKLDFSPSWPRQLDEHVKETVAAESSPLPPTFNKKNQHTHRNSARVRYILKLLVWFCPITSSQYVQVECVKVL